MGRQYSELANSLANTGWYHTNDEPDTQQLMLACLIDAMRSLRAIAAILKCPNLRAMALAVPEIKALIRGEIAKRKKKRKRRAKATA